VLSDTSQAIQYETLANLVPIGLVLLSLDADILYLNQTAARLLGQPMETLHNLPWNQVIHPDDALPFLAAWPNEPTTAEMVLTHRVFDANQSIRHLKLALIPQTEIIPHQLTYAGYLQDITEQKQIEAELKRRADLAQRHGEQLYITIAESVPVGLYHNDAEGKCIYINQKTCEILDITFEECLGTGWADRLHPEDAERMLKSWQRAFEQKSFWQDEYRFLHRNGRVIWVLAQCQFIFDDQGNNIGSIGGLTDITQQKELEKNLELLKQKYERLATEDSLTRIANRRCFDICLTREWYRLRREQGPLSLLLIDVDHFKLYNDTFGHNSGDRVLKAVAQVLARTLRRSTDLVARYGGEEFAIILPHTDVEGALQVAHQIAENMIQLGIPHAPSASNPYLTLSLGLACVIPNQYLSPKKLVGKADEALYQAKQQGRNRTVVYRED
jgi:diguanylate cyclase (GGDEF)-like protein/PAS domain S-box-containing protein